LGCQYAALPDGTSCADANLCNGTEQCYGGACVPGQSLDCDDHEPCTTDDCVPASGCTHTHIPTCTGSQNAECDDGNPCTSEECIGGQCAYTKLSGTPCPDADLCNGAEVCEDGRCGRGASPDCDDRNFCTADFCDPANGCGHTAVSDGAACGDADPCNG